jgi:hypothetical protein
MARFIILINNWNKLKKKWSTKPTKMAAKLNRTKNIKKGATHIDAKFSKRESTSILR